MSTRTKDNILEDTECRLYITCNFSFSGKIILKLLSHACQMGLAAMVGCPPPLPDNAVMFITVRHSDHKSGRMMTIVTAR